MQAEDLSAAAEKQAILSEENQRSMRHIEQMRSMLSSLTALEADNGGGTTLTESDTPATFVSPPKSHYYDISSASLVGTTVRHHVEAGDINADDPRVFHPDEIISHRLTAPTTHASWQHNYAPNTKYQHTSEPNVWEPQYDAARRAHNPRFSDTVGTSEFSAPEASTTTPTTARSSRAAQHVSSHFVRNFPSVDEEDTLNSSRWLEGVEVERGVGHGSGHAARPIHSQATKQTPKHHRTDTQDGQPHSGSRAQRSILSFVKQRGADKPAEVLDGARPTFQLKRNSSTSHQNEPESSHHYAVPTQATAARRVSTRIEPPFAGVRARSSSPAARRTKACSGSKRPGGHVIDVAAYRALEAKAARWSARASALQRRCEDAEAKLAAERGERQRLEAFNAEMDTEVQELRHTVQALVSERQYTAIQLNEFTREIEELRNGHHQLQQRILELTQHSGMLEVRCHEYETEVQKLQSTQVLLKSVCDAAVSTGTAFSSAAGMTPARDRPATSVRPLSPSWVRPTPQSNAAQRGELQSSHTSTPSTAADKALTDRISRLKEQNSRLTSSLSAMQQALTAGQQSADGDAHSTTSSVSLSSTKDVPRPGTTTLSGGMAPDHAHPFATRHRETFPDHSSLGSSISHASSWLYT